MPRQRNRFVADALHQAAVAGDHIGVVIDKIVAEARIHQALRQRHPDCGRDPLPQRPRRRLHAGRMPVFRMAGGFRSPLPERLQLVRRHTLVASQMQQRIQQHRAVTGRQYEPVAIRPRRIGGVEFEEARKQHRCDIGHAHRHAGMARLGVFDGVDGQKADRIRHFSKRDDRLGGDTGQSGIVHSMRLLRSISCRISGVRMSCIARSSFDPWITIELARDMKLFGIIDSR